jgi:hypothetical protein
MGFSLRMGFEIFFYFFPPPDSSGEMPAEEAKINLKCLRRKYMAKKVIHIRNKGPISDLQDDVFYQICPIPEFLRSCKI